MEGDAAAGICALSDSVGRLLLVGRGGGAELCEWVPCDPDGHDGNTTQSLRVTACSPPPPRGKEHDEAAGRETCLVVVCE